MPWIKSCLCHHEKKKTPTISPPIHLLLKNEDNVTAQGPSHAFRCKTFKKPRPCHLCHQPILNEGSCCRVCKYVCHKVCESKEAVQRYTDTSWSIHRQSKKNATIIKNSALIPPPAIPESESKLKNGHKSVAKNSEGSAEDAVSLQSENGSSSGSSSSVAKCVDIEVSYEPVKEHAEVVLHSHDDHLAAKNGTEMNKMIASTSFNGFGEALTTQPRSSRSNASATGGMDLSYVTEKIISVWFPGSSNSHSYRQGQRQAAHMLRNKHGDNYMVFNLTEPKRALRDEHKHVKEVGWAQNLAPPLERLCSVCKEIDSWLSVDKHRIAVLHARGNKEKLGVIVAAYMHYSSICGTNEQALDRFSMRKFLEDNVGPLVLPSNKRYVEYFSGLLSRNIKINADPLYLTHVTVLGAPNFQQQGGCRAFLKLYEGQTPVYTSGVYNVSSGVGQFTVNLAGERRRGLQLRGDILIKCYHRESAGRETVFACQFHTCAVADYTLSFTRQDLDVACNDARFPVDGAVELHFSSSLEGRHPAPAPTPAVPFTPADDSITRADSPFFMEEYDGEDSDSDDVNHTFGPLDGSIYASISKKPELSPGAVSSPLTVSMDSGISSAGHQQNANTAASASPPLTTSQPSPLTPEEQHRELDELLSSMMLTVQSIPDLKPDSEHGFGLENVRYIDEEVDDKQQSIPYHARQDSRPFSYGVNSSAMITDSKAGLSSPSLVRKASINKSSGDTLKKVQTQVYPSSVPNFNTYNNNNTNNHNNNNNNNIQPHYSSSLTKYQRDPIDDIFTTSALSAIPPIKREFREEYYRDEIKRYDPLKRSYTDGTLTRRSPEKTQYEITYKSSPYSDSESLSPPGAFRTAPKSPEFHESYALNKNLTWLQKQQLKLKERREVQLREERHPHETRLLSELRQVHSRHMRPTASHRLDGYTSDTTAFADDDDDYTIPLHINTMQRTNNYSKQVAKTTERPFMTVKRAHERYAQSGSSDAAAVLAAHPLGQVVQRPREVDDVDSSGLLQEYKHGYTNSANLVGIDANKGSVDSSPASRNDTGIDALNDLIANLSSGSDKSSNSPNTSSAWHQYREESWRSQTMHEAETSPSHTSSPRPQTPAFPVNARTPYTNPSTPTVQFDLPSERLPPKSPTTQRRLSCPSSSKVSKKWSLSPERKDRPTSPTQLTNGSTQEYNVFTTPRSVSATPTAGYNSRDNYYSENYQQSPKSPTRNGSASPTVYFGNSRRSSVHSNNETPQEVSAANVKFVRDTSKYWYKPAITREEAINMLRDQPPGTFVVRDSNSFQGAFGMALKVSSVPSNFQAKPSSGPGDELIRHFLIEPTSRGVRLKGCPKEPVFSSLSALVYQHSVTALALPCRLILPEGDLQAHQGPVNPAQQLLMQGAACNVLYLYTLDMESLTGPEAVKKAVYRVLQTVRPETAIVHFKVNGQGITITDNKRKLFFRKHYPINAISHCGLDPEEHRWSVAPENAAATNATTISSNRIFGFIARKPNASTPDNQCHLFAELEPEQPATAIVNFVNKILTSSGVKLNIV